MSGESEVASVVFYLLLIEHVTYICPFVSGELFHQRCFLLSSVICVEGVSFSDAAETTINSTILTILKSFR